MNKIAKIKIEAGAVYASVVLVSILYFEWQSGYFTSFNYRFPAYVSAVFSAVYFGYRYSHFFIAEPRYRLLKLFLVPIYTLCAAIFIAGEVLATIHFSVHFDFHHFAADGIFLSVLYQFMRAQALALYAALIFLQHEWPRLLVLGGAGTFYLYARLKLLPRDRLGQVS
jgi:hypothetical protein